VHRLDTCQPPAETTHGEYRNIIEGKPTRSAGRAAAEHRKRRGSTSYVSRVAFSGR
jgi:hypothetical protein